MIQIPRSGISSPASLLKRATRLQCAVMPVARKVWLHIWVVKSVALARHLQLSSIGGNDPRRDKKLADRGRALCIFRSQQLWTAQPQTSYKCRKTSVVIEAFNSAFGHEPSVRS